MSSSIYPILIATFLCVSTVAGRTDGDRIRGGTYGSDKANLGSLKFVQVIMRHGDRNPIIDYPSSPYKDMEKDWPGGFGQLTQRGEEQTCELGAYLRMRYDAFLPTLYHMDTVAVWSSFTDRSIRSAGAALRGLFPRPAPSRPHLAQRTPGESNETAEEMAGNLMVVERTEEGLGLDEGRNECLSRPAQIVPIRTVPKEQDNFIYYSESCPAFKAEHTRFEAESEEVKEMERRGKPFSDIVVKETGIGRSVGSIPVGLIYDYLFVQEAQKKKLPYWYTPEMRAHADAALLQYFVGETGNRVMQRLRSGTVQRVLGNMEEFVAQANKGEGGKKALRGGPAEELEAFSKGKRRVRQFVLYSGHDKTIVAFLNILGAFNRLRPPYATAILVELHKHPNDTDFQVNIFLRNDTRTKAYPLVMDACAKEGPCTLSRFREMAAALIPKDFQAECQISGASSLASLKTSFKSSSILLFYISPTLIFAFLLTYALSDVNHV